MRKYGDHDEERIRTTDLLKEWTRSGLLEEAQAEQIRPSLQVELRRTNIFLRLILLAFGILIIGAVVALIAESLPVRGERALALLCLVAATVCGVVAESLVSSFRLYRFGVEEAGAIGSVALVWVGTMFAVQSLNLSHSEFPTFVALIAATAAAGIIFARFGFVYAGILAMLFASMAPFHTPAALVWQRLLAAVILTVFFLLMRRQRTQHGGDFQAANYEILEAAAWLGVYVYLNLMLPSDFFPGAWYPPAFHMATYLAIWIIPATGLALAIRERSRPMLDVNIVLMLATLATNKLYLGLPRQTWDPILLGLLLIGTAFGLRRWLAAAPRGGFTAEQILDSDRRRIAIVGTASVAFHNVPAPPADTTPPQHFEGGGGRSGGGGAGGTF